MSPPTLTITGGQLSEDSERLVREILEGKLPETFHRILVLEAVPGE